MKVENKIKVYAIDGKQTTGHEQSEFIIKNVWNRKTLVELQFGDGPSICVCADELKRAILNSINIP